MEQEVKRMRYQEKCRECRKQRVKCNPYDRDWEGKQQKCERCNRLGLDCGPNIRKKDEDSNLPASSSSIQQSNSQSPREGFSVQNVQYTEPLRQSGEREEWLEGHEKRSPTATSEDFRSKSLSRLRKLNMIGTTLQVATNVTSTHCCAPQNGYEEPRILISKLKEEYHTLFIKTYNLIKENDIQGHRDVAHLRMEMLLMILQKFLGLLDHQKRGGLLGMASFFCEKEDRPHYEWITGQVADMADPPTMPIDPHSNHMRKYNYILSKVSKIADPRLMPGNPDSSLLAAHLLVESYLESDESEHLKPILKKHYAEDSMPSDVNIPPLLRAAEHSNPRIVEIMVSRQRCLNGASGISDPRSLHVAAANGNVGTLSTLIDKAEGQVVDARNAQKQTPLFLAAANGHEGCCRLLLNCKADPNSRDSHQHNILEVAAKSGNLNIVKMLVAGGADLRAPVTFCASTPLQAAIESGDPSGGLVRYLLDQNVDVSAQRWYDKETAMSLAQRRGLQLVVQAIGNKLDEQQPSYFPL